MLPLATGVLLAMASVVLFPRAALLQYEQIHRQQLQMQPGLLQEVSGLQVLEEAGFAHPGRGLEVFHGRVEKVYRTWWLGLAVLCDGNESHAIGSKGG